MLSAESRGAAASPHPDGKGLFATAHRSGKLDKRGVELGGLPAACPSLGGFVRCFAGSTSLPAT
jgi:hypothetical protein